MDRKSVGVVSLQEPSSWRVYVDGTTNQIGSGMRLVLISPEKITIEKSLRLSFSATNNKAECEALLVGMTMVQKMRGKTVEVFSDSRLVVGQVKGELEAKDARMQEYLSQVKHLKSGYESFNLQSFPRVILVEDLCKPTKMKSKVVHIHQIRVGPSWMDPIVLFLKEDILLEEESEVDKVQRKAPRFYLFEDQKLYKCSSFGPYLLCIHPKTMELLLEELHEGICGSHTGGRSLSHRALRDIGGQICKGKHKRPFPKTTENKRWLLVGTDYFTKWVETEPLANIKDMDAKRFIWKNIVTQFEIPYTLISYNGLQFDSKAFRRYCCDLDIANRYSTPAYSQGNGQVETVNKVIVSGLKKRLDDAKGKWVEELPHFLWTYQTTPRRSTRKTPFSLTYGVEAVIPLETGFPMLRTSSFTPSSNDGVLSTQA
ncbi:uncharacterized protein LOC115980921 [Quercus lobata]|uniref:uncharacterized protein LOC115980921 n=1 Tax=Quercus lobata TaxID=97700 RepID=UPI001246B880|nr:uncharacterized protein LOC115980921 [Quercus lobata]